MPIAWHPKIWWNFGMSIDEKKEKKKILLSNAFNASDTTRPNCVLWDKIP